MTNRVKNAALGSGQTQFDPVKAVENALILDPQVPSIQLAERLAKEAMEDPVFIQKHLVSFFFRSLKSMRRKEAFTRNPQRRLPGFEHLPIRIRGVENQRLALLDANYKGVREWVKHLNAEKRDDPTMKEAKALLEKMSVASKADRDITVRRVFGL